MDKTSSKSNVVIVAIVAGIAIAGTAAFAIGKDAKKTENDTMGKSSNSQLSSLVDKSSDDYKSYMSYTGEEYDRVFIANMISHHEGAVEMAKLALGNANHAEIKTLAMAISSTQTGEIASMSAWQKDWGYPTSSGEMLDHSSMGMMTSNAGMMSELNGKTGEVFDKVFLEQMITHHQSAINMSAPARSNAKHQEVKDLATSIITAQTKEILQMRQWQKDWGFTK